MGAKALISAMFLNRASASGTSSGGSPGRSLQGGRLIESYYAQQAFWNGTIAEYKQTVLVAFQEVSDALVAQQTLVEQNAAWRIRLLH